jgi:superfamily II RNA helicase
LSLFSALTRAKNMREKQREADLEFQHDIEIFAAAYPFPLDPFQYEAMRHLAGGRSVLVTAPTGTGKTVIAEYAIWRALQQQQRVIYTAPLKALSNQKYRDLSALYGSEHVGLMTGDIVEHRRAAILVMTTEIYRNMLLEEERRRDIFRAGERTSALADVSFIIFDELHYLSDRQRGPVWEEAIICSPHHVQLVGLSATVSNAEQLARWISRVHRPIALVVSTERAVPLDHYYLLDGRLQLVQDAVGRRHAYFPRVGGEALRALRTRGHRRMSLRGEQEGVSSRAHHQTKKRRVSDQEAETALIAPSHSRTLKPPEPHVTATPEQVLITLREADLLPCLYFLPGRRLVEEAAITITQQSFTTPEEQRLISQQLAQWQEHLSKEDRELPQVRALADLLPRGIGYHHAGLLPGLKVVVETLFARGLLRAVFATDTLVLGVNMPARAVVVGSLSKFDGQRMRLLTPNEYRQLTGRAGRRGLDTHGAAIIPYSPWEPFEESFGQISGELLPVTSSFVIDYYSVLNLWRPHDIEYLEQLCAASLREYQIAEQRAQHKAQRERSRQRKARRRAKTGHTQEGSFSEVLPAHRRGDAYVDVLSLSPSGAAELHGTIFVLRTLGYIGTDDQLTLKGELLRRLPHQAGIMLVDLLLHGTLDSLSAIELAEVFSWLAFESDRRLNNQHVLSTRLAGVREKLWRIEERVLAVEEHVGIRHSPETRPDFHGVALCWARGKSLYDLLERIDLAEGDILLLLNQSIDLLEQAQSAVGQVLDARDLWSTDSPLLLEEDGDEYRARGGKKKGRKRLRTVHASLTLIRPRLAQASRSLLHGIVLRSRTIPSMSTQFTGEGLPLDAEEDIDLEDMHAEEVEDAEEEAISQPSEEEKE